MEVFIFESNEYGFLRWVVNEGVVIDSEPSQRLLWEGVKVKVVDGAVFTFIGNEWKRFFCALKRVEPINQEYEDGFNDGIKADKERCRLSLQYKLGHKAAVVIAIKELSQGLVHAND